MALTGRFCEILYTTNIILLSIVTEVDIFKCVFTSGLNGLIKDISSIFLFYNIFEPFLWVFIIFYCVKP